MQGTCEEGVVLVGGDARQRFYDARGYGRPGDDGLELAPVEAAHLLYRGDLEAVDGMGFREYLASVAHLGPRFLVYKDLRDRGFYLSPAREGWVADPEGVDLVVYPRGSGPWDDAVAYRVRTVAERDRVPASSLDGVVLAVVDEESEITYFETGTPDFESGPTVETEPVAATLLDDRVVAWAPPAALHRRGFFGQPLDDRDHREGEAPLQLSLLEAAYLAAEGRLAVAGADPGETLERLVDRGRAVEGDRFDRRLRAYRALRDRGLTPKTGFKFGADFRVYEGVESVDSLGHALYLVRVLPPDFAFSPRDLALDVRLAHGVRKRMIFARDTANGEIDWLSASRLTP
ncbi:MAG: tRNA-intron lyase [Halobacteriaceae archaeon]